MKPNTGSKHLYKSGLCVHCLWPYSKEKDVCKECELVVSHENKLKMEIATQVNNRQTAEIRMRMHDQSDAKNAVTYCLNTFKEADPTGRKPSDPGSKLDAGKPKAALLRQAGLALLEIAKVLTIAIEKKGYTRNGWLDVPDGEDRYDDAFWRHILYAATEAVDKDTGLPHDVQEAVNALFKLELRLRREKNERNESSNNSYQNEKLG